MKHVFFCLLLLSITFFSAGAAQASDFKAISEAIKQPILLDNGESSRMHVIFPHSAHKGIKCTFCHHAAPSEGSKYTSCSTNEECHYIKGAKERDVQSVFMAFHSKDADRACYTCHKKLDKAPLKGCRPCHTFKENPMQN